MRFFKMGATILLALFLGSVPLQAAVDSQLSAVPGDLAWHVDGAAKTLSWDADYDWWYGCSPTSTGMLLAYYDVKGYGGLSYSNLVPGADAEESTFGTSVYAANAMIASSGHIDDFYSAGYGGSGDDDYAGRAFDCLADFMGTSQDSAGNSNGGTTFYYYTSGAAISWADIETYGIQSTSGMYGILEYLEYAGYTVESLYNQYIDSLGLTYGFTFDQYKAEIDAGRGVLIHVQGHTMYGYGYDEDTGEILLHDTWTESDSLRMVWGGTYSGLQMFGVTVVELAGGDAVPEPASLVVWALLGSLAIGRRRRRRRR